MSLPINQKDGEQLRMSKGMSSFQKMLNVNAFVDFVQH